MKKFVYFLMPVLFFIIFIPVVRAEEIINNFEVTLDMQKDGSVNVAERIDYDFGMDRRHGIYREIPYKYKARGGNYKLRISNIKVTDDNGIAQKFSVSSEGDNKKIKIGDAGIFVSGEHTYIIRYKVKRAINYFSNKDELYWNSTGNEWPVKIEQSKTTVILPKIIPDKDLASVCYTGPKGSTQPCISSRYKYTGKNMVEGVIFSDDRLQAGSGVTIAVSLPKGIIIKPGLWQNILDIAMDNWIILLPFAVFIFLYFLWRARGRDPEGRGTIVAQFEAPDKLTPLQIGVIIDERADKGDISAEIIYLAVKGYIKIHRIAKEGIFKSSDYILEKLKNENSLENDFDKEIMQSLFKKKYVEESQYKLLKKYKKLINNPAGYSGSANIKNLLGNNIAPDDSREGFLPNYKEIVSLSSLKNEFYEDLGDINKQIYESAVAQGYFPTSPNKVRNFYLSIGVVPIFAAWIFSLWLGFIGIISLVISAALIIVFGFFMPRKTKSGVLAYEHILGLKEYLRVAEKDRIEFHNAPEKNPQYFEKMLPFAMVLGVEKAWAKQFADIYKNQSPSWYSDSGHLGFSAMSLNQGLSSFSAKANSTLSSSPSSASGGGSGFSGGGSGGGFGGGGGGSW